MKTKIDVSAQIEQELAKTREKLEREFASADKVMETVGGWDTLLNKKVLVICAGYFYEGKLTGVNASFVELEDTTIVYNPDSFTRDNVAKCLRDKLPTKKWYIDRSAVESYGAWE